MHRRGENLESTLCESQAKRDGDSVSRWVQVVIRVIVIFKNRFNRHRHSPVVSPLSFWNCMMTFAGSTSGSILACLAGRRTETSAIVLLLSNSLDHQFSKAASARNDDVNSKYILSLEIHTCLSCSLSDYNVEVVLMPPFDRMNIWSNSQTSCSCSINRLKQRFQDVNSTSSISYSTLYREYTTSF